MPLTLSDRPEVRSRQAATTGIPAAAVGTRRRIRTDAGRLVPRPAGAAQPPRPSIDVVEEWGLQSFPASDPPPTW